MKKSIYLLGISLIVSATMLMTACSKDNTTSNEGGGDLTSEEWVDLGLPSGLLWANCNVGAQKPEGFGNYYAWGETSPKEEYSWGNYAYGSGPYELTKYCEQPLYGLYYYSDSLSTLEASDDAATVNLGEGARTPTKEEWQELKSHTTRSWTTLNGVYGCLLTASNGNSIFLPAAGSREESSYYGGNYGGYWSSSVESYGPNNAWLFNVYKPRDEIDVEDRCIGLSVRAVRDRQN